MKDPIVGIHDWVVSYDVSSMYPMLICHYNISPETKSKNKLYKRGEISPESILSRNKGETIKSFIDPADYLNGAKRDDLSIAANGVAYSRTKQGFLPELMETMFTGRKRDKMSMLDAKENIQYLKEEAKRRGLDV